MTDGFNLSKCVDDLLRNRRAKGLKPCPSKGGKKKRMPISGKTPWGRIHADGREVCDLRTVAGLREYNRRIDVMVERQDGHCRCGKRFYLKGMRGEELLGATMPTFGHDIPRGLGGGSREDRIELPDGTWMNQAECWDCNGEKGSKRIEVE